MRKPLTLLIIAAAALAAAAPTASAAPAQVFGKVACAPQEGVVFCPGSTSTRVPTFDGVPLDLNVTLPATGSGPYPLVVLVHGWGGQKGALKDSKPWAERGYAVLYATARGFNGSCGTPQNRNDPGCATGWIRLDDTRYEVRDVQHLAGMLVDEGIADPRRIGVQGCSYGGGVSVALGLLRDRVMQPDGTYAPWTSPKGRPMSVAATAPCIPWTDLVYSLVPNGRHLDYTLSTERESRDPSGVMKQTFVSGLYALGSASGFYSPPGVDQGADLTRWFGTINAGEPYDGNPLVDQMKDEIYAHHSGVAIKRDRVPAPMLISNGWTDDLFPVDEAIRLSNLIRAEHPTARLAMVHMDYGHQRGQGKDADEAFLRERVFRWFDHYVKGSGAEPASDVTAIRQTCPADRSSGEPITAASWPEIHPGEVRLTAPEATTFDSSGGSLQTGQAFDPIAGPGACASTDAADQANAATYRFPASAGYTLVGSTTIIGDFQLTGAVGQVAARLLDVAPDGKQTLVARGLYRLTESGRQVFQLHPNAWRFEPGHVAKVELLGNDLPYGRQTNGAFTVAASNVDIRLPVNEAPGGGQVVKPAAPVVPPGRTLAPAVSPTGGAIVRTVPGSRRPRVSIRRLRGCRARVTVSGSGVKRLRVIARGRTLARDTRAPFRVTLRTRGVRSLTVVLDRTGAKPTRIVRRLRRC